MRSHSRCSSRHQREQYHGDCGTASRQTKAELPAHVLACCLLYGRGTALARLGARRLTRKRCWSASRAPTASLRSQTPKRRQRIPRSRSDQCEAHNPPRSRRLRTSMELSMRRLTASGGTETRASRTQKTPHRRINSKSSPAQVRVRLQAHASATAKKKELLQPRTAATTQRASKRATTTSLRLPGEWTDELVTAADETFGGDLRRHVAIPCPLSVIARLSTSR